LIGEYLRELALQGINIRDLKLEHRSGYSITIMCTCPNHLACHSGF
jgi:hypothetical protein